MMEFINRYKKGNTINKEKKIFYFNEQLKQANGYNQLSEQENIFNINNYVFDDISNKFINKNIYKKGKNYLNTLLDDYHNENIILQYNTIEVVSKINIDFDKLIIPNNALFPKNAEEKMKKKKY